MEIPSRLSCPRYDTARSGLPSAAKDESGGKNHAASVQQLCRAIGCEIASDPDQAPCAYPGAWLRICVCLPLLKARSIRLSCVPFALRVTVPVSRVDPAICVAAPVRATDSWVHPRDGYCDSQGEGYAGEPQYPSRGWTQLSV